MRNDKQKKAIIDRYDSLADEDQGKTDRIKYINDLVKDWIINADNKVSISLAVFAGAFGVITFAAERFVQQPCNVAISIVWDCIHKTCFCMGMISMLIALIFYAIAIIPNLTSNSKREDLKKYPIFYGDIAEIDEEEFFKRTEQGHDKDFREELEREIVFNSKVCLRKMKMYRAGVITSIIAIIFAFLGLIARFMMY